MKTFLQSLKTLLIAVVLFAGVALVSAQVGTWTAPTQTPPNGNTPAPLNVGTIDQVKNAGLALNTLWVNGQVKITDGTEGDGKVLTSNAAGVASWKNIAAVGGGGEVIGGGASCTLPTDTVQSFSVDITGPMTQGSSTFLSKTVMDVVALPAGKYKISGSGNYVSSTGTGVAAAVVVTLNKVPPPGITTLTSPANSTANRFPVLVYATSNSNSSGSWVIPETTFTLNFDEKLQKIAGYRSSMTGRVTLTALRNIPGNCVATDTWTAWQVRLLSETPPGSTGASYVQFEDWSVPYAVDYLPYRDAVATCLVGKRAVSGGCSVHTRKYFGSNLGSAFKSATFYDYRVYGSTYGDLERNLNDAYHLDQSGFASVFLKMSQPTEDGTGWMCAADDRSYGSTPTIISPLFSLTATAICQ